MGVRHPWETRLAVYALITRGHTMQHAAQALALSRENVKSWARIAGMTLPTGRPRFHPEPDTLDQDTRTPDSSYHRLTLGDRAFIQAARSMQPPLSLRSIAKELAVAPSTVSRELQRASIMDGRRGRRYSADVAHFHAKARRPRPRPHKLDHPHLRSEVVARLNEKHSPRQVSKRLLVDFPDCQEMRVSHETIYQALYVQGKGALRHELTVEKAVRSGRTTRQPRSKLPPRPQRSWLAGARLSDRPAVVEDRAVPGHWEGDLVVGPQNSGIVTLVERSTRYGLVGRLPGRRDSETVIEVLQAIVSGLPQALRETITWDQGAEMAQHVKFSVATGCRVFFCDPHSPWQRGSNENYNGLVRDFYPKGTNFNTVSDGELADMQRMLNDRPRETLGWATPREKLNELLTGVALTP